MKGHLDMMKRTLSLCPTTVFKWMMVYVVLVMSTNPRYKINERETECPKASSKKFMNNYEQGAACTLPITFYVYLCMPHFIVKK